MALKPLTFELRISSPSLTILGLTTHSSSNLWLLPSTSDLGLHLRFLRADPDPAFHVQALSGTLNSSILDLLLTLTPDPTDCTLTLALSPMTLPHHMALWSL